MLTQKETADHLFTYFGQAQVNADEALARLRSGAETDIVDRDREKYRLYFSHYVGEMRVAVAMLRLLSDHMIFDEPLDLETARSTLEEYATIRNSWAGN